MFDYNSGTINIDNSSGSRRSWREERRTSNSEWTRRTITERYNESVEICHHILNKLSVDLDEYSRDRIKLDFIRRFFFREKLTALRITNVAYPLRLEIMTQLTNNEYTNTKHNTFCELLSRYITINDGLTAQFKEGSGKLNLILNIALRDLSQHTDIFERYYQSLSIGKRTATDLNEIGLKILDYFS